MFAKSYLSINDAIKTLEKKGVTIRLSDLQDLARDGVITPLIYVDADFVNSTYPTGVEVEPKRINERHRFTRFNGYVSCKNANVLDAYVQLAEAKAPYFADLFFHDTDLLFEVVDCLPIRDDAVSNGKTGYLFEPLRTGSSGRHSSLQRISIKDVRLYRSDVEAIISIAAQSVDKQKIIDELTSQLAAAQAEIAKLNSQLKERSTAIDDELKEVPYQSFNTVDKIMYAMAKLTKFNNSHPTSQNMPSLNAQITTVLQNDGLPLGYETVGKWLKRINEIKPIK